MRYEVNTRNHDGIYHRDIEPMVCEAVEAYGFDYYDVSIYADSLRADSIIYELNADPELLAIAQSIYTPFPMQDSWIEEYKAYYRRAIEDRTAPGKAEVDDEIVRGYVRRIVDRRIRDYIAYRLEKSRKLIQKAQQQGDIPSPAEARQREREWNNTYNEGGYGFVPHVIDSKEYAAAQAFVERFAEGIDHE